MSYDAKKLDRIKAACRKVLELDQKSTLGPWIPELCDDPQWWIKAPGQQPGIVANTVGGNDEANAAFIAYSRTITREFANMTLAQIDKHKYYAKNHSSPFVREYAVECLQSIADSFTETSLP